MANNSHNPTKEKDKEQIRELLDQYARATFCLSKQNDNWRIINTSRNLPNDFVAISP